MKDERIAKAARDFARLLGRCEPRRGDTVSAELTLLQRLLEGA